MNRLGRASFGGLLAALVLGGCSFTGLNSRPLPLTKGAGEDAITLTVYLDNAVNLVPNSEVRVADVTVGSVRRIELDHWKAKLTIGLEPGTRVPADATAKIGQKSLLGAEYLDLASPRSSSGRVLRSGEVIPLERTSRYPETEEVLSAAALLLNGGGLEKVQTITHELNLALDGRTADARSLIRRLAEFVEVLDRQRHDIIRSMDQLDRLSRTVTRQEDDLDRALADIPDGLEALDEERHRLTKALDRASTFSVRARALMRTSGDDLDANLESLRPAVKGLADAGDSLAGALGDMTFPYPMEGALRVVRGDYVNFFATVDLRTKSLTDAFLTGSPLDLTKPILPQPLASADPRPEQPAARKPAVKASEAPAGGDASAGGGPSRPGGLGRLLSKLLGGS